MRELVGPYRITRKLGEGGMGVVYAARDERLQREVALKMIRREHAGDATARERFWREARLAASINHPQVCQLYDIVEADGELFLAMELLTGESLADRAVKGALPIAEAVGIGLAVLSALEALHRLGIVHRDLKPSNVFLTAHGVKLLDFGLARPLARGTEETNTDMTLPGLIVGTPKYMAPEQLLGQPLDARVDLFAAGALLYELLAGQSPFEAPSVAEVMHRVTCDQPPVLGGSPAVAAVDRVIHRALSKRPDDRYPSAAAMADALRTTLVHADSGEVTRARPLTRLIVLPFRALRPDPEIDFLSFSLADAITGSLSPLESLVVRSSLAAAGFAGETDLKKIAEETDVDAVLTGTLLRSGDQLRVSTQLLEAPTGTVVWSHTQQGSLSDIFALQDELSRRIVESLSLPLSAREHRMLRRDVPATAKAYEFYLRANQLSYDTSTWTLARDLYLQCLAEDPQYAPAWARIGRLHRVIAKFRRDAPPDSLERAQTALERALELNPDLSVAHNLYAQLEIDLGRARDAMVRLVRRATANSGDPELFAGLVHACRYCGLIDASLAAHERARRLDPHVRTSVHHTYFMAAEYERVIECAAQVTDAATGAALASMGRDADAIVALRAEEERNADGLLRLFSSSLRLILEGDAEGGCREILQLEAAGFTDPEWLFYTALVLARVRPEKALEYMRNAVDTGYYAYQPLARHPWLDPLRARPEFARILHDAEQRQREARAAFREAGGERLLGLMAPA